MKKTIFFCLGFFVLTGFIVMQNNRSAQSTQTVKCNTGAYVIDKDPNGLNVRKTPGGKIINRIPHLAMVRIAGQQGKWINLKSANYPSSGDGFAEKNNHPDKDGFVELKNLNGWVFAALLGTTVRKYSPSQKVWLYKEPYSESKKIIEVTNIEAEVTVKGCNDNWLLVKYKNRTAWLDPTDNCPNSLTTCP